eukprot:TRINITY_DN14127_c0_g1_i1.p1 TRINITY_DN14127_c0_g1~~TRINITY_DN14127_c0_g1_i1.p1  ORF type:complete len:522 (-),score=78.64 TRINITY_DN14127_c0_g1_i1:123-1652(-)
MACWSHVVATFAVTVLGVAGFNHQRGNLMRVDRDSVISERSPFLEDQLRKIVDRVETWRLLAVADSVRPSYEAFPKNAAGRLPPQEVVPAVIRSYFAAEHGWLLRGLEPPNVIHGVSKLHETEILQDKAPGLARALQDSQNSDEGFSLNDVIGIIAALEHLIIAESYGMLRNAYFLNNLSTSAKLDTAALHEVLLSYLLIFRWGGPVNLTDVTAHLKVKEHASETPDWAELADFVNGILEEGGADASTMHTLDSAERMVDTLAYKFGKWQNVECVQMKETLKGLTKSQDGQVPYEAFKTEPAHASFQFTETAAYLQRGSALIQPSGYRKLTDNDDGNDTFVLIANYMLGPSNCIAPSNYHSVCCLNECEIIMRSIEELAQAPILAPQDMHTVIDTVDVSAGQGSRPLPPRLVAELDEIAKRNDGVVTLHSPDFRDFLHEVFPYECPRPTTEDNDAEASELTAARAWLDLHKECTRVPVWHPSLAASRDAEMATAPPKEEEQEAEMRVET